MSTGDSDVIDTAPTRSSGSNVSDSSRCRGEPLRQKKTRPTATAGRVASDPSLAWLIFMLTEDTENVNR